MDNTVGDDRKSSKTYKRKRQRLRSRRLKTGRRRGRKSLVTKSTK